MRQSLNKREKIIIIIGVLLIVCSTVWIASLYQTLHSRDRTIESNNVLLKEKTEEANKTATYIDAICAEYRKLYQSYREARFPDQTNVDKYAGLPGSAKGQIDECYLP